VGIKMLVRHMRDGFQSCCMEGRYLAVLRCAFDDLIVLNDVLDCKTQ